MISPGSIFRHVKGIEYVIVGFCRIEKDLKLGVLYKATNGKTNDITWMMPIEEFTSTVVDDGKIVSRFKFIKHQSLLDP